MYGSNGVNKQYHPLGKLADNKHKPGNPKSKGPIHNPHFGDAPQPGSTDTIPTNVNYTACAEMVTPACIAALYGFSNYKASSTNGNTIAATGYLGQYFNSDSLHNAENSFNQAAAGYTPNIIITQSNGGETTQEEQDMCASGGEADLDIQTITDLTYPSNVVFYSTDGVQPYNNLDTNAGPAFANQNEPYSEYVLYNLSHM